jgi:hypothetical protein
MPEAYHIAADQPFPEASPSDHEASFDVPSHKAQESWDHYLEGGDRKRPANYQDIERRSRASRIDRLISVICGMKMISDGDNPRDQRINEFQEWAPTSLAEGNSVIKGQQRSIRVAEKTSHNSAEAVLKRMANYQGYLIDAANDLDTLQRVREAPEDSDTIADPFLFRNSPEAQEVIIKQLISRGFLWDKYEDRWPAKTSEKYKEREKYWRGFMIETVKNASNDSLTELIDTFYERAKKRFQYWNGVYSQVEDMPIVRGFIEKGQLMPITASNLLAKKYQRTWEEDRPLNTKKAGQSSIEFDSLLSPIAQDEITRANAADEARVENHNRAVDYEWEVLERSMRYLAPDIREILATRGLVRALSASEQFEADDQAEIAEITERANHPKENLNKATPRKRGRKWRGESGPSDKRKEPDYR